MYKINKSAVVLICIFTALALSSLASADEWDDWYDDYSDAQDAAGAFLGLSLIACAVGVIIWFVIWILIAIWVYRDAEKRGSSGALWLIIVILLGLIGIIIWLVVRPPIGGAPTQQAQQAQQPERRCPNCGRPIPMDARVCPYCSKKFDEP